MLKNYFKVSLRNLWKNKGFSAINIFGLATGMACSLLIFLFVHDEKSYDRYHKNAENIYRVVKDFVNDDGSRVPDATTPPSIAPAIQKEIPGVENVTRVFPSWGRDYYIKYGDKTFSEHNLYRVDSSFFDVFTFSFLKGEPQNALGNNSSVVLTESAAKKYFGDNEPIGKVLTVDDLGDMMVTAIIEDVPQASHFHFDVLVSVRTFPAPGMDADWGWYNFYTYARLKPRTDIAAFTKQVQQLYKRNREEGSNVFYVQPVTDIHLTSNLKWELEANSDKLYVYVFTIIAIFILLIAGINYVNLATAKASVRAKEIGVRKVAGAYRSTLIKQLLVESVITCMIAAALALLIAQLLLPTVNSLTQKQLTILGDPSVPVYLTLASILLGVIAGVFPAIYLSSFKPIIVLKGLKLNEKNTLSLRKGLVILQFTISIVLIIGAIIISQQINFIQSTKLGLNKDQVLIAKNSFSRNETNAFLNDVAQIPGVKKVSTANGVVGGQNWTNDMSLKGTENSKLVNFISVSNDFVDVMGMELKEGRNFSEKFPGDTMTRGIPGGPLEQTLGSVLVNETTIKNLGIPEPAVGRQLLWGSDQDTMYYLTIVGVIKDFHFTSMRSDIKPFAFINNPRQQWNYTIKLSPDNLNSTLAGLETAWKKYSNGKPFEYSFLDETFARLYQSEARFQKLFISLVILGIVISCLGLLGLSIFAAQRRIKEIGIRKVLGASVPSMVRLLSKDFLKLVAFSLVLAIPISWYAMNKWLQDFAYRINVEWWVFVLGGFIAMVIAFLTISFQTVKSALANPVKNLRTE
jgi:putative ABC transport system permease protein